MNNSILLVSTKYITDNTSIDGNIDPEIITPHILSAQNRYLENVLGTALFDKIMLDVENDSVTGDIKILLDKYIQPALAQWVFFEALPFIYFSVNNKGLSIKTDENSDSINLSDMKYLRSSVRDNAEFLSDKTIKFLIANPSLYPLHLNAGSDFDTVHPEKSVYFNGIIFDSNN